MKDLGKNLVLGKTLCLPGTGSKSRSPKIQQKEELEEWGAENRPRQIDARGPRSKWTQRHFCLWRKVWFGDWGVYVCGGGGGDLGRNLPSLETWHKEDMRGYLAYLFHFKK